ncbi:hypothetical protein CSUI_003653 [Cystoisospora suis]|uniref:Uncharacterized protein n=1 Tax=Cystoisospora suis TaxID=483139 RepID=A0A2C6KPS9_9APIC|nr:hypothetical protein CSUI_003653 [Cystoisospora suis]
MTAPRASLSAGSFEEVHQTAQPLPDITAGSAQPRTGRNARRVSDVSGGHVQPSFLPLCGNKPRWFSPEDAEQLRRLLLLERKMHSAPVPLLPRAQHLRAEVPPPADGPTSTPARIQTLSRIFDSNLATMTAKTFRTRVVAKSNVV